MKKLFTLALIVIAFVLVGVSAKADGQLKGRFQKSRPNIDVVIDHDLCARVSSSGLSYTITFNLGKTCGGGYTGYSFGFTSDSRVVLSASSESGVGYVVSTAPARNLRQAVEHKSQSEDLGYIKQAQNNLAYQQAMVACMGRVADYNALMSTTVLGANISAQSAENECEERGEKRDLPLARLAYRLILNNDTGGGAISQNDLDENTATAYAYNTFIRKCDKKGRQVAFTPLNAEVECSKNLGFNPGIPTPAN